MDNLNEIMNRIKQFSIDRDWVQFHSPENLVKSISIEAGELLECFQWDNNYNIDDVKDEVADVMNYCLQLCIALNIDPIEALNNKQTKNENKYPIDKCKGKSTKYDKY